MRSDGRRMLIAAAALGAAALAGCTRMIAESSVVDDPAAAESQLEWLDRIEKENTITNNDALHGLLLVAEGEDPGTTYYERVEAAKERRWLREDWDRPANESAKLGDICAAICRILEIRGGINMLISGPTPRNATRELVYMEIIPDRVETQAIRGLEFIDLLTRVDERKTYRGAPPTVDQRIEQMLKSGVEGDVPREGEAPVDPPLTAPK